MKMKVIYKNKLYNVAYVNYKDEIVGIYKSLDKIEDIGMKNVDFIKSTNQKSIQDIEIFEGYILEVTNFSEMYQHKDYKFKYLVVKWKEYGFFLFDEKDRKRFSCNSEIIKDFGLIIKGNIFTDSELLKIDTKEI